jgi:hypothetical protein
MMVQAQENLMILVQVQMMMIQAYLNIHNQNLLNRQKNGFNG